MATDKKIKIITLIIAILVLLSVGTGINFLHQPEESQKSSSSQSEVSLTVSNEPEQKISQEQGVVSDSLILVKGGSFTMGSPDSERQRQEDEIPHKVTISSFFVDPYEVTQHDYNAIMGKNPSHFKGDNLPVEKVTWYDAIKYCNALSESRGLTPVYTINGTTVTWDRSALMVIVYLLKQSGNMQLELVQQLYFMMVIKSLVATPILKVATHI